MVVPKDVEFLFNSLSAIQFGPTGLIRNSVDSATCPPQTTIRPTEQADHLSEFAVSKSIAAKSSIPPRPPLLLLAIVADKVYSATWLALGAQVGKTPPESPGERFAKNYLPSGSKDERERAARRFDAFATTIGAIVVIVAAFAKPLARLYNQWFSRESLSTAIAVVVAVAVIGLLVWLFGFLFRKGWNAAERKQ